MRYIKKYSAILILLLAYPSVNFIVKAFVLEESDEIYAYIPQESDFVVEINLKNFIAEMAYQRIFEEAYFMKRVYDPEKEKQPQPKYVDSGFDPFGKVILFREQWANESIWIALFKYNDKERLQNYLSNQFGEVHCEFSDDYAIVQLTPSSAQEKMNEHLKKIALKEVKSFNERAILSTVFDPSKEINCYIIPKTREYNQLIDGYLSFDFLEDRIAIEGHFTPVSEFGRTSPIAYAINPEAALSVRSSLNFFNSIYWFSEEKIEDIPEYSQMVFDYDGVECKLVNRDQGFTTPFKSYPKFDIHFDVLKKEFWYAFMDSLISNPGITVDTINHEIITQEGAHFRYVQNDQIFELTQDKVELMPSTADHLYFDFHMDIDALIDRTTFTIDENNPPSDLEQKFGLMAARGMLGEIKLLANIEEGTFQLIGNEDGDIIASGALMMKNKTGSSLIESLSFGSASFSFFANYLSLKSY